MRVLIAGSSGFIGSALKEALIKDGHEVVSLVRREPSVNEVRWQPELGYVDCKAIGSIDAAINLAGETIFGRWTPKKKLQILNSRIQSTRTLAVALSAMSARPAVFVSASGVNYYGDRGDEELSESSGIGNGFLAEVCGQWEAAANPAVDAGIRVVTPRMGVVLSGSGGSLKKMLLPFRMGLGARFGSGKHFMSWITLHDSVAAYRFAMSHLSLSGPVNFTTPNSVRNRDFTAMLASVLKRPAILSIPRFALRAAFGDAADELLLSSVRVKSSRLTAAGFTFQYPELGAALRSEV